jgi:dihydrofolate reductase
MRQLILQMSMSVDGFVAGPNNELDWIFKSLDDGTAAWTMESLKQAGIHAMGSNTFRDMAAYWPSSTEPFAIAMNDMPKAVFSRAGLNGSGGAASPQLEKSWQEARVLRGELREEIERLKQEDGKDILAHGGASFAQSLVEEGLIDEYRLLVHPIVLGSGKALFARLPERTELTLQQAIRFPSGAVIHVYRPA